MALALTPHPDTPCRALTRIEVEVRRPAADSMALRFIAHGDIRGLALPQPAASERTNDLWKHTCFEAFLRARHGVAYAEFNFAPSTQWAIYAFEEYRQGMRDAGEAPRIDVRSGPDRFELHASFTVPLGAHRLALSAVIEEADGAKSYWALAHPPGKPDFHHESGFAYELPAPEHT